MKLIVDSACDFDEALVNKTKFTPELVPFNLLLDDNHYVDDGTINLTSFIKEMRKSKSVKTAAPSPEFYLEKLKGDEGAFIVTISQAVSASYESAILARQTYLDENKEKFIHVFDSKGASTSETTILLKIKELLDANVPNEEIVKQVDEFISGSRTFFCLEKYDNLVKNGRMNAYVAKIASILSIKPVCAAVDGKLEMIGKARGMNKALIKIIDLIEQDNPDFEKRILAVAHVKCPERALWFVEEIQKRINIKNIIIVEARGLVTTYADDQGIIVTY